MQTFWIAGDDYHLPAMALARLVVLSLGFMGGCAAGAAFSRPVHC